MPDTEEVFKPNIEVTLEVMTQETDNTKSSGSNNSCPGGGGGGNTNGTIHGKCKVF